MVILMSETLTSTISGEELDMDRVYIAGGGYALLRFISHLGARLAGFGFGGGEPPALVPSRIGPVHLDILSHYGNPGMSAPDSNWFSSITHLRAAGQDKRPSGIPVSRFAGGPQHTPLFRKPPISPILGGKDG